MESYPRRVAAIRTRLTAAQSTWRRAARAATEPARRQFARAAAQWDQAERGWVESAETAAMQWAALQQSMVMYPLRTASAVRRAWTEVLVARDGNR